MMGALRLQCWCIRRECLLLQRNSYDKVSVVATLLDACGLHFALKLVLVAFAALGAAFPTFSLGF